MRRLQTGQVTRKQQDILSRYGVTHDDCELLMGCLREAMTEGDMDQKLQASKLQLELEGLALRERAVEKGPSMVVVMNGEAAMARLEQMRKEISYEPME